MQNYAHLNRDVKMGPFIFQSRKNGSIIYSFLGNRGLIVYLATLKQGAIRAVHSYHVVFRESPSESYCPYLSSLSLIAEQTSAKSKFVQIQYLR